MQPRVPRRANRAGRRRGHLGARVLLWSPGLLAHRLRRPRWHLAWRGARSGRVGRRRARGRPRARGRQQRRDLGGRAGVAGRHRARGQLQQRGRGSGVAARERGRRRAESLVRQRGQARRGQVGRPTCRVRALPGGTRVAPQPRLLGRQPRQQRVRPLRACVAGRRVRDVGVGPLRRARLRARAGRRQREGGRARQAGAFRGQCAPVPRGGVPRPRTGLAKAARRAGSACRRECLSSGAGVYQQALDLFTVQHKPWDVRDSGIGPLTANMALCHAHPAVLCRAPGVLGAAVYMLVPVVLQPARTKTLSARHSSSHTGTSPQ